MLAAVLAEEHFQRQASSILGPKGYSIEDERVGRTDTDFRLLDVDGRPLCRLNVKFHGTLFRESQEYVGLATDDCFPLATYKISSALKRQNVERLPYAFLILPVPDFPRTTIEESVNEDWAWLASISGRSTEEAIVAHLASEPWVEQIRERIRATEFRLISARRAYLLPREFLFERVHALRLRGFNRLFRGAEINMHLSLGKEMIAFEDFLMLLADRGSREVAIRLDRGEI